MPGLTAAARNSMLASLVGKASPNHTITHMSLHDGDPGTTGNNEYSGGSYARQAVSEADFGTPTAGEVTLGNDIEFDGVAQEAVNHIGLWDGTEFLGGRQIDGSEEFNSNGKYVIAQGTKFELDNA